MCLYGWASECVYAHTYVRACGRVCVCVGVASLLALSAHLSVHTLLQRARHTCLSSARQPAVYLQPSVSRPRCSSPQWYLCFSTPCVCVFCLLGSEVELTKGNLFCFNFPSWSHLWHHIAMATERHHERWLWFPISLAFITVSQRVWTIPWKWRLNLRLHVSIIVWRNQQTHSPS